MHKSGAREPDWLGRGTGLVVFFIGIVLLVVVFVMTVNTLKMGPGQIIIPVDAEGNPKYLELAVDLGLRFGRLFLMGFVAGLIAGRGAQLYAAANQSAGE